MKVLRNFLVLSFLVFLLAGCKPTQYNVSFVTNNDQTVEVRKVEEDSTITNLPTLSKVGYNFDGWYTNEDFSTKYKGEPIISDMTLYAKWVIKQYTVKFVDGTTELALIKVNHGTAATAPSNPTKVGHTFKQWDKDFTNVTSDLTVNAVYDKETYEVIFKVDDVQVGETQNVKFGESATAPENPTKVGYTFKKWDKAFNNVTGNLVVNAVFEILKFEVKFCDFDGFIFSTQVINYNESATAPDSPTREGYVFVGWDNTFTNVTSDLTITAVYEDAYYEVKFMHGETVLDTQQVKHGTSATAPTNLPAVTGYAFSNWDKDYSSITDALVVNAVYTVVTYNIKYYDGETLLVHLPSTYNIEMEVSLQESSKSGYYFVGWYLNADFSDEIVTKIPKGTIEEITLYGKWLDQTKKYTVSYELNGGSWTWTTGTTSGSGIDSVSNLPEIFMIDLYTYLKDNNLLTSSLVASTLRKATWTDFSKSYTDPVAIYNWTSTGSYTKTDGYSQFFYDTATGDPATGELLTIEGGFFGTEPYKTKYQNLVKHLAYLQSIKYPANQFWSGGQGKSGAGFVLDGYFYNTQGVSTGNFALLRKAIPNTNSGFKLLSSALSPTVNTYPMTTYIQGLEGLLSHPSREGYVFAGWYTTSDFSTPRVYKIPASESPASVYYAKWVAVADY